VNDNDLKFLKSEVAPDGAWTTDLVI